MRLVLAAEVGGLSTAENQPILYINHAFRFLKLVVFIFVASRISFAAAEIPSVPKSRERSCIQSRARADFSCGSPLHGHMEWRMPDNEGDTSGHCQKQDAVTAEMSYHQAYQKGPCVSRWQNRETGKRQDLLGLHIWLRDANAIRIIGSEEDSTCMDREPLFFV